MTSAGSCGHDADGVADRGEDLIAERDELAIGLPVGFYTGWLDAATEEFRFDYVSPRAAEMLGVTVPELISDWRTMMRHVDLRDRAALEYEGTAVTEPGDEADWTGRVIVDGRERWLHVNSREYESRPGRWLGIVADVTERKQLEMELARLAMTDPLTGLGNRRLFEDQSALLFERWQRAGGPLALALLDIDFFKEVNDSLGHHAGDRALVEIGRILRRWGRQTDVIARMGGDEFAILMPQTASREAVAAATRISRTLRDSRAKVPHLAPLSMSIGIVCLSDTDRGGVESADVMLRRADDALYRAKAAGRDCIEVVEGRSRD